MKFLEHRIADPRMLRLIRKWLRAGVSEDGEWSKTEVGTPQGAVISPLLSNIYLHYVLDLWVSQWRKSKASGEVIIVRYADDFVMGFQYQQRGGAFPGSTEGTLCRVRTGNPQGEDPTDRVRTLRGSEPGRTGRGQAGDVRLSRVHAHMQPRPVKGNRFTIRRKTIAKRLRAKLKEVRKEIMRRRHEPVPEHGKWLRSVVQGHLNYFAVPGNR